jgi:hypothetical protein
VTQMRCATLSVDFNRYYTVDGSAVQNVRCSELVSQTCRMKNGK